MPCTLPEYNSISTSEKVRFQTSSGAGKEFVVWQDIDSNVKIVKCDLCSRFILLQGRRMSTSSFKRYCNGAGYKGLVKQNSNQLEICGSTLEFIITFQVPREFMLFQSCVTILIVNLAVQLAAPSIITPVGSGPTTPTATCIASENLTP